MFMIRLGSKSGHAARGFTVIELMIATTIFTILLLVVVAGVMQFTHQYYRGVIGSQTQNVARRLLNSVAQTIEFSPGKSDTALSTLIKLNAATSVIPPHTYGYCVGPSQRYSFQLGKEVNDTPAVHALISDVTSSCSTSTYALDASNGNVLTNNDPNTGHPPLQATELLGAHMRLSKFDINPVVSMPGAYSITVKVVYGDDDLLCSPSKGDCNSTAVSTNLSQPDITCKRTAGSQFCATAEYSTVVEKRVN